MRTLLIASALVIAACSGPTTGADSGAPPRDSATGMDAGGSGSHDAGSTDSGASDAATADAGHAPDASADAGHAPPDAAPAPPDAAHPPDAAPHDCGDFGKPCAGSADCGTGYACDDIRHACVPIGRPSCGGIAGTDCPPGAYSECRFLNGADFGPCLTPAEDACACPALSSLFQCP